MRQPVDFTAVYPEHREIDARLAEWAKWCRNQGGRAVHPMFRFYRSSEQWGHDAAPVIDTVGAQEVQKAFTHLPELNRWALAWAYVFRTPPKKMAQKLGLNLAGLADEVHRGRTMIRNRLTVG
jgi:DNA-directed RNA polymerase specialized sigma24 family protein